MFTAKYCTVQYETTNHTLSTKFGIRAKHERVRLIYIYVLVKLPQIYITPSVLDNTITYFHIELCIDSLLYVYKNYIIYIFNLIVVFS